MIIPYRELVEVIQTTAQKYGRQAPDLLAVSKTQPVDKILPLLKLGHRFFGESKVQEAGQKWPNLKKIYPDVRLHLIGPLQTNKVRDALQLFDVIETIDRPKLAEKIAKEWPGGREINLLIQINTGLEPQKSGVSILEFPALYRLCVEELSLPIVGLMCLPPQGQDPTHHFQLLAHMAQEYRLPYLSMGMSHDYPKAIRWGTSWVRLGTALFGER